MPGTDKAKPPLSAAHHELHERLLARIEQGLVAATRLDFASTHVSFSEVGVAISRHRRAEELALAALPIEPVAPRGASTELVTAEHDKLDEVVVRSLDVIAALTTLGDTSEFARRVALVRHLESLLRVRHLLEHHTLREESLVYPHLEDHLPEPARARLEADILETMQQL